MPTTYSEFTNGISSIYFNSTTLKIRIKIDLNVSLYDSNINKLIPYVFVNYSDRPLRLDTTLDYYYVFYYQTGVDRTMLYIYFL